MKSYPIICPSCGCKGIGTVLKPQMESTQDTLTMLCPACEGNGPVMCQERRNKNEDNR